MLVLSRKAGEKLFIGDNIVITIVDIERGKIRIGIDAPKHVSVSRAELLSPQQQAEIIANSHKEQT
jgi:carbon storage regulator